MICLLADSFSIEVLLLMTFVSGVESFQQGSHDVPWDLLVLVYQRLDSLLHLPSKKHSDQEQHWVHMVKHSKGNCTFNPN